MSTPEKEKLVRRTAAAQKAILDAWNKEQELVREGKGTREWTPEQQQDILEKGKAYDEEGLAFQGQHMKSAERYPEYQGDPGNIQFLTRDEHFDAHNGNWRNPTNCYYNPVTKERVDFGDGPYIPCEIIELPNPIIKPSLVADEKEKLLDSVECEKKAIKKSATEGASSKSQHASTTVSNTPANFIQKAVKTVVSFSNQHPVLTNIVKIGGAIVVATVADTVKNSISSGTTNRQAPIRENYDPAINTSNEPVETKIETNIEERNDNASRASYTPNDVPAGSQRYHYKDGVRWKDKAPYHRGGDNDK